jgi:hypothetical protein
MGGKAQTSSNEIRRLELQVSGAVNPNKTGGQLWTAILSREIDT